MKLVQTHLTGQQAVRLILDTVETCDDAEVPGLTAALDCLLADHEISADTLVTVTRTSAQRKREIAEVPDRARAYDDACCAAALDQGLGPATLALVAAGFTPFIEQTGGFTMVLTVTPPARPEMVFTITCEDVADDEETPLYRVVYQPVALWHGDNAWDDSIALAYSATAAEVVALVRSRS